MSIADLEACVEFGFEMVTLHHKFGVQEEVRIGQESG